jgi:alpha-galactosidase
MKSKPNNYCSLVTLAFCLGLALTGQAQTKGVERQVLPASGTTLSVLENAAAALNRNWADELFSSAPTGRLPFSFVYGGKPSLELFTRWTREVKDETIGGGAIRRTLTLTDPETRLEVRAVCLIYLDTAGVDWTLYFTNKGDKDSPVIEQLKALDASIGAGTADSVVLHRLNGAPCQADDWMPFDQSIAKGQRIEFAATNGRSSNVSPWFTADWGGGGVITAIGWSGQWNASVRFESGRVHTQVGMENLHTLLHPGESIRSPRILQLRWEGGDVDRAYNFFRHTMFAHIMPRIDGQLVWPPIVHLSTSFYELNDSNEQNVLSHLESLRGLGFEMFWLDAYWTGPSGFPNSMGNYGFPMERVEPKDRFPSGLRAIADAVEKEGLKFLMWFEPERVAAGTLLAKEHPEWVLSPSGDGSGLFNLGIPEARQFMTAYLNAAIKAYKLSCLRIDYNIDPLAFWRFMDAKDPNRAGMSEIRYVEGLYQMWDELLKANHGLFIDNCASGGRRIDLETLSRSLPLWRSDNTCDMLDLKPATVLSAARKNQLMSAGLNRYVPFSTVGQMGSSPYLFRSGFNAGIAFAEDVRPKSYPRDLLKQGIAEGKRIRKYFAGDFYPLVEAGVDPGKWVVMQYHRPKENDGMVMAFRRDQSADSSCEARLRDIDPAKNYEILIYRTYEPEKPVTMKGAELSRLRLEIPQCPGSLILEYRNPATPLR